jgi:hypothetical protein
MPYGSNNMRGSWRAARQNGANDADGMMCDPAFRQ